MTGAGGTNSGERPLILAAVAILVGGSAYDFNAFSTQRNSATTTSMTTTTTTTNSSGVASSAAQYTVNGLACKFPSGTPSDMVSLISKVTTDPRFLAAANGSRFVSGNFENITDRIQVIGGNRTVAGTTIQLPDVTELVFYS